MKQSIYCAIIGDINNSRQLVDRVKVQREFQKAVDSVNADHRRDIVSKFTITQGDEVQGLLISASNSYRIVRRFQDIMGHVPFAFGIGVGKVSTPLNPKGTMNMDGECFHRARNALLQAKKGKREVVFDFDDRAVHSINALVGLMEKQWLRMTPRQREISQLMKVHKHQIAVANKLKVSAQAISKAYSSTAIKQMNEAEDALHGFLSSLI